MPARSYLFALLAALGACSSGNAISMPAPARASLAQALHADLQSYLNERRDVEKISAVSLSVSLPNGSAQDVTAGTTFRNNAKPVTPADLYQIASNTKAFTGIVCLQLQSAGKLKLDDTLGKWLPQYPQWKNVRIRQLLDMTSGIQDYDLVLAWQRAVVVDPKHFFTPAQLIGYVANEPRKHGYLYSNTNYILAELVIEKAAGKSYTNVVRALIASVPSLRKMYYYPGVYPKALRDRTVAGYFDVPGQKGLEPIVGENVRDYSLSWCRAAGGIVATPHDVGLWDRAMYQGSVVNNAQRKELETLVSTKTGRPIARTTPKDPGGFGLGVGQSYTPKLGRIWFYEGESLGYRLLHVYVPPKNLVVVIGLNSVPDAKEDHVFSLFGTVYATLRHYGAI